MIPKKPQTPRCFKCKGSLAGARTVIDGQWHCPRCTYLHDYPDLEVIPVTRLGPLPVQEETLFDIGRFVRRDA